MSNVRHMTEIQLRTEAARLRELVNKQSASLSEANRLAEIEAALKRIAAVRDGKAWG